LEESEGSHVIILASSEIFHSHMEFQLHMPRFGFKNAISESSVTGKKSGFHNIMSFIFIMQKARSGKLRKKVNSK
jgi:hypothetical protein